MKNQFEILNNTIIDFTNYEDIYLSTQDKTDIQNRIKKRIIQDKIKSRRRAITAALLVLILISVVALRNETVMAAIKNAGIQLSEYVNKQGENYDEYKTVVGNSVQDKGISITLNDAIVDDSQFIINCTANYTGNSQTSTNSVVISKKIHALGGPTLFIDGKQIKTTCYDITTVNQNGTSSYKAAIDTSKIDLKKVHNFKVEFDTVFIDNTKEIINGKWQFKFNADGKAISQKVISIPIQKKVLLEKDLQLNVEELRITPISMRLFFNQGKVHGKWVSFKAIDNDGTEIEGSTWALSDEGEGKQNFILKSETKKIKLVPMIDKVPQYDKSIDIDLGIK